MFWILKRTRLSSGAFFNAINNNLGSGGGSGYLSNRNGNQSNGCSTNSITDVESSGHVQGVRAINEIPKDVGFNSCNERSVEAGPITEGNEIAVRELTNQIGGGETRTGDVSRKGYNKLSTLMAEEEAEDEDEDAEGEEDEEEEEEDGVEEEDVSMGGEEEEEVGKGGGGGVGGGVAVASGGGRRVNEAVGGGGGVLSVGGVLIGSKNKVGSSSTGGVSGIGGGVGCSGGVGVGLGGSAGLGGRRGGEDLFEEDEGGVEIEEIEEIEDDEEAGGGNDSLCYTDYEISDDSDYEESLTCNVCDRYFPTMRLLAQHQQKKRHFGCSACDSLFPSLMALEHHKEEFDHWSEAEESALTDDGSDVGGRGGRGGRGGGRWGGGRGRKREEYSDDDEEDRDEDAISEEHERLLL